MNKQQIASAALAESTASGSPDGLPVSISKAPDGSVTYSLVVSIDPEVQKEMSKAMPKGMKRDDLADDLGDDGGGATLPLWEHAEDSAPCGLFTAVLDELAADASPSRYSKTPLTNCRARDPMFCPYHGDKAIKAAVETTLAAMKGISVDATRNPDGSVTVKVTDTQ